MLRAGMKEKDPTPAEINRLQYSECEAAQTRSCGFSLPSPRVGPDGRGVPLMMHCRATPSGAYIFDRSDCATPIVISWGGAPVLFTHAPAAFAIGPSARTEWVSAATPWLVRDADETGCVEDQRELFGADATSANGFEKLARLDANHDGVIDAKDPAFVDLALWYDRDQDKACTREEMTTLDAAGIVAIELAFVSSPPGLAGSHEGERATVRLRDERGREFTGHAVDVYLSPL